MQGWYPTACFFHFSFIFYFLAFWLLCKFLCLIHTSYIFIWSLVIFIFSFFGYYLFLHIFLSFWYFRGGLNPSPLLSIFLYLTHFTNAIHDLIWWFFHYFVLCLFYNFLIYLLIAFLIFEFVRISNFHNSKTEGAPILSVPCTTFLSQDGDLTSPQPPTRRINNCDVFIFFTSVFYFL